MSADMTGSFYDTTARHPKTILRVLYGEILHFTYVGSLRETRSLARNYPIYKKGKSSAPRGVVEGYAS